MNSEKNKVKDIIVNFVRLNYGNFLERKVNRVEVYQDIIDKELKRKRDIKKPHTHHSNSVFSFKSSNLNR